MQENLIRFLTEAVLCLLQINCETDFVAKNDSFKNLVARVTEVCHRHFSATEEDKVYMYFGISYWN